MGNILKILGLVADAFNILKKIKLRKGKRRDEKEQSELESIFNKHSSGDK